jgi:hypothetical protein
MGNEDTLALNGYYHVLRHPRLLGAFIFSELKQAGTANAALGGAPDAWARIAIEFLWQFLMKYIHRRESKDLPSHEEFNGVLHAVASKTSEGVERSTENDWLSIAWSREQIPTTKARRLFEEALSGGLIVVANNGSDREWEWRHPFVADYLASDTRRRHCP